jgi:phage/plasmid-like protein (TIGR03299 family)
MAHELEMNADGTAKMFFVGDPCWHGLGTPVQDAPTSLDALRLAQQDWDVVSTPVMVNGNALPDYRANVRDSDGAILGIVSDKYKIVQNREGFAFLDDILKTNEDLTFESAGCLFGGKRTWILAKLPASRILGDEIVPYMVFSNGHDGKHPVSVCMTPTRVVCNNTLTAALKGARRTWSFRHMGDIESRKREASETLMLANQYTVGLTEFAEDMVQKKISTVMLTKIIDDLFPADPDSSDRIKRNVDNFRNQFLDIYLNKPDLQNIRGTAWGLYNAAGDFASHIQPARRTANFQEGVFASFLDGNKLLDRVQELVIAA